MGLLYAHSFAPMIGFVSCRIDATPPAYPQSATEAQAHGANGCFGRVYTIEGIQTMILHLLEHPATVGLHDQDRSWEV
jgi:hypothetical protein